jgi:UDP-N-acetylmuramate dehydrogenase
MSIDMVVKLPTTRGKLTDNQMLSDLTWLRVGGPAEYFFQPSDLEDLRYFLSNVPDNISLFPIGVGSNLLVRDGGIKGVVIRLGKGFNSVEVSNGLVVAGAAALDSFVARRAADNGYDLTFLRTIPGSIGGALKMNAGCYGKYISDYFVSAKAVNRSNLKYTCRNSLHSFLTPLR